MSLLATTVLGAAPASAQPTEPPVAEGDPASPVDPPPAAVLPTEGEPPPPPEEDRVETPALVSKAPAPPVVDGSSTGAVDTDEADEKNHAFTISLNQDMFFGFYPTAAISYELSPGVALTSYGILWTRPGFGVDDSGGAGLWTEFGAGAAFSALDRRLRINPQIGMLSGKLLSGGSRPLVGEGIVPNATIDYSDNLIEAQLYFGYYIAVREPRQNDFVHYWANAGVKAAKFVSAGAHWEHLILARTRGGDAANIYQWIGPYVQFSLPTAAAAIRLSGGFDVADKGQKDFYKVSFVKSF
jgi:hypothetical protein